MTHLIRPAKSARPGQNLPSPPWDCNYSTNSSEVHAPRSLVEISSPYPWLWIYPPYSCLSTVTFGDQYVSVSDWWSICPLGSLLCSPIPLYSIILTEITLKGIRAIFRRDCFPTAVHQLNRRRHIDVQRPKLLRGARYRIPRRIDAIHLPNLECFCLEDLVFLVWVLLI